MKICCKRRTLFDALSSSLPDVSLIENLLDSFEVIDINSELLRECINLLGKNHKFSEKVIQNESLALQHLDILDISQVYQFYRENFNPKILAACIEMKSDLWFCLNEECTCYQRLAVLVALTTINVRVPFCWDFLYNSLSKSSFQDCKMALFLLEKLNNSQSVSLFCSVFQTVMGNQDHLNKPLEKTLKEILCPNYCLPSQLKYALYLKSVEYASLKPFVLNLLMTQNPFPCTEDFLVELVRHVNHKELFDFGFQKLLSKYLLNVITDSGMLSNFLKGVSLYATCEQAIILYLETLANLALNLTFDKSHVIAMKLLICKFIFLEESTLDFAKYTFANICITSMDKSVSFEEYLSLTSEFATNECMIKRNDSYYYDGVFAILSNPRITADQALLLSNWCGNLDFDFRRYYLEYLVSNVRICESWVILLGSAILKWTDRETGFLISYTKELILLVDSYAGPYLEFRDAIMLHIKYIPSIQRLLTESDLHLIHVATSLSNSTSSFNISAKDLMDFKCRDSKHQVLTYHILNQYAQFDSAVNDYFKCEIMRTVSSDSDCKCLRSLFTYARNIDYEHFEIGVLALVALKKHIKASEFMASCQVLINCIISGSIVSFSPAIFALLRDLFESGKNCLSSMFLSHLLEFSRLNPDCLDQLPLFMDIASKFGNDIDSLPIDNLSENQANHLVNLVLQKSNQIFSKTKLPTPESLIHVELNNMWELVVKLVDLVTFPEPLKFMEDLSVIIQKCNLAVVQNLQIWVLYKWIRKHKCLLKCFLTNHLPVRHEKCRVITSHLLILFYSLLDEEMLVDIPSREMFLLIIPLCMAKEFRSRAMSVLLFIGLWNRAHHLPWDDLSKLPVLNADLHEACIGDIYPVLYSTAQALTWMPDIEKGLSKLAGEYMISKFRPFLKNVSLKEFRMGNNVTTLSKNKDSNEDRHLSSLIDKDVTFFQRKVTSNLNVIDSEFDVILVASLVEKSNNIGGICRTGEIFGCSKVVVSDLENLKIDKGFQSLVMTADKWLSMEDVPISGLRDFIKKCRSEGYRIIGLEQTSQSIPLQNFIFPAKSVFIMGREKDGIPVDVIQMLDACVEIPQFGNVRSLNVHVSASIVLWEARRQWLKATKNIK